MQPVTMKSSHLTSLIHQQMASEWVYYMFYDQDLGCHHGTTMGAQRSHCVNGHLVLMTRLVFERRQLKNPL